MTRVPPAALNRAPNFCTTETSKQRKQTKAIPRNDNRVAQAAQTEKKYKKGNTPKKGGGPGVGFEARVLRVQSVYTPLMEREHQHQHQYQHHWHLAFDNAESKQEHSTKNHTTVVFLFPNSTVHIRFWHRHQQTAFNNAEAVVHFNTNRAAPKPSKQQRGHQDPWSQPTKHNAAIQTAERPPRSLITAHKTQRGTTPDFSFSSGSAQNNKDNSAPNHQLFLRISQQDRQACK
jgi:hypothetical protein